MIRSAVRSTSLCDQWNTSQRVLSNVRRSKSESSANSVDYIELNGGNELLMESVVSAQTRQLMRDAVGKETFGMIYPELVRSNSLLHLPEDHVRRLHLNILSALKFIEAVLESVPQACISQRGLVASMNMACRLTLDWLIGRKGTNDVFVYVHYTFSDVALKQWMDMTIRRHATGHATQRPPRHHRSSVGEVKRSSTGLATGESSSMASRAGEVVFSTDSICSPGRKRKITSTVEPINYKKRAKYCKGVQPKTAGRERTTPADGGEPLIWPEVADNVLYVYVSKKCTREHYSCLSRRLGGDGNVDPITRLLLTLPLPVDSPRLSRDIINFFHPERSWCKEVYYIARNHSLSLRDARTENIIRHILQQAPRGA